MPARRALLVLVALVGAFLPAAPAAAVLDPPAVGDSTVFDTDQGLRAPDAAVTGPDGAWWGVRDDQRVVRIDATGAVDLFDIPLQTNNASWIVVGADGALWVFAASASTYVRVTVDGTVTSHADPVTAQVRGAAAHPDGTIWLLTETEVVRLATDGTIAGTMPLPGDAGFGFAVTPGGDGLALVAGELVRVEPDGDTEATPLPGVSNPNQVVVRPDGAVFVAAWDGILAEVGDEGVEVVDLDGEIIVRDLAVGPEGDVWVAGDTDVVRVTAEHELVPGDLPEGTYPNSISAGLDGTMWVPDIGVIHHVAVDGSVATTMLGVANPFIGTVGPDGNAWIGGFLDGHIGRVAPDGTIEVVADVGNAYYGMTTGPDGNLWVTGGDLFRITPTGETTSYPLLGIEEAWDVTVGPDGNLWVADRDWGIARVQVEGITTAFSTPFGFGQPFQIAAGGDGNLWVSAQSGTDLLRVTPGGTMTIVSVGAVTEVRAITAARDGSILIAHGAHELIRVAPDGSTSTIPTPGFMPFAMTEGPDGNLWMIGSGDGGQAVAQLTPDGTLTVFPTPSIGRPFDIVATPDGYLWAPGACCFGANDGHSLTRVAMGVVDVELDVAEDSAVAGGEVHASVTVTNAGRTGLTGIAVTSDDLPGCAAEVPDLDPGDDHTVTCTSEVDADDPVVTVDTTETQPKTASDVVEVSPAPTCFGHDVTVDLNRGQEPTADADVVLGTPEADTIATSSGDDVICAGAGDDEVLGGGGNDRVAGGPGRDTIDGGIGDDVLRGVEHPDQVTGGPGVDVVDGGEGVDRLHGGAQADRLLGGPNRDACDGGGGIDRAASCEVLSGVP